MIMVLRGERLKKDVDRFLSSEPRLLITCTIWL